jgi:hypothetical protein
MDKPTEAPHGITERMCCDAIVHHLEMVVPGRRTPVAVLKERWEPLAGMVAFDVRLRAKPEPSARLFVPVALLKERGDATIAADLQAKHVRTLMRRYPHGRWIYGRDGTVLPLLQLA